MFDIEEELKKLPESPGVYLHKDRFGQIIYVGKAISLRRRVRQYFQSPKKHSPKVRKMVENIAEFEYILCDNEVDALILECRLIKQYNPKYNILLRDDKSYPYIKVSLGDDYPIITRTRRLLNDGARYFGPYPFVTEMDLAIELLNSVYNLKRCRTVSFPEGSKPCLNYHIHRCSGLCTGLTDKTEYRLRVDKAIRFLEGDDKEILDMLKQRMYRASENMEYEAAAGYRDFINAVSAMDNMPKDPEKLQRRLDEKERFALEKKQAVHDGLCHVFGSRIGEGIHRIEAYDISNMNGLDSVGGMVVFKDGRPEKTAYRKFRIKAVKGANDVASLKEVLYRRFTDEKVADELPDLILMDGGAPQLGACMEILGLLNLPITAAGMVKDDRHRTKSLLYNGHETLLKETPGLFAFIGTVQEEVHRFAISYHHQLRGKGMQGSALDKIPGIGEKRRSELLKRYGSIDRIKDAPLEELEKVPSMDKKTAKALYEWAHK